MIMKEDFVSYDLAVKLKEKGFKEQCVAHYYPSGSELVFNQTAFRGAIVEDCLYSYNSLPVECFGRELIDAPTIHQVLKWLREENSLHIEIISSAYGYIYIVSDTPNEGGTDRVNIPYKGKNDGGAWDDYNECVLDAIEYIIDNLI